VSKPDPGPTLKDAYGMLGGFAVKYLGLVYSAQIGTPSDDPAAKHMKATRCLVMPFDMRDQNLFAQVTFLHPCMVLYAGKHEPMPGDVIFVQGPYGNFRAELDQVALHCERTAVWTLSVLGGKWIQFEIEGGSMELESPPPKRILN